MLVGIVRRVMEPSLKIGPFRFFSTFVQIEEGTQVTDWLQPLSFALWCQRAAPWWIGDLLLAGDAQFGEEFSQACQGWISGEQLQRYESIARRVPPENRRPSLSWSAHAAVARLDHARQRQMLELAERYGWSSEELRVRVRAVLRGEPWPNSEELAAPPPSSQETVEAHGKEDRSETPTPENPSSPCVNQESSCDNVGE